MQKVWVSSDDFNNFKFAGAPTDNTGEFIAGLPIPPSGTTYSFEVKVFPPPGSPLVQASAGVVTVTSDGTVDTSGFTSDIKLSAGAEATGKVTKADGSAFPGVYVEFSDATGTVTGAATDADGEYTVGLPAGTFTVKVFFPFGVTPMVVPAISPVTSDGSTPVSVPDIVLSSGSLVTGRVVRPDGTPAPGVFVEFSTATGPVAGAPTDGNGNFTAALPAGTYSVAIFGTGFGVPAISPVTVDGTASVDMGTITLLTP